MKPLLLLGAGLAFLVSIFLMRAVIHGYTHHAHLDVLHLTVAIGSASVGVLLLRGALRRRTA